MSNSLASLLGGLFDKTIDSPSGAFGDKSRKAHLHIADSPVK